MEEILRAIVLGIVQGLTEFLPISSSGHLILAREFFGWELADDLTFDVAVHVGTLAAVIVFFWSEWVRMARSALEAVSSRHTERRFDQPYDERLLLFIVIASIPIAITGFVFEDVIDEHIRDPVVVGAMFVVFGIALYLADRLGSRRREIPDTGWLDAVAIGAAQALSLIPGVSRSGITITAGLSLGFVRQDAARFSFLLATPAVLGAGLLKTADLVSAGASSNELAAMGAGIVASGVVAWLTMHALLALVQTRSFLPFVVYRVAAGAFVVGYFAV